MEKEKLCLNNINLESNSSFSANTQIRFDHDLLNTVYKLSNDKYIEIVGREDIITNYEEGEKLRRYYSHKVRSFVTIPFIFYPPKENSTETYKTDIIKHFFHLAADVLNKFIDDYRSYLELPSIQIPSNPSQFKKSTIGQAAYALRKNRPHYSKESFTKGIYREYDEEGNIVATDNYVMNTTENTYLRPDIQHSEAHYLEFEELLKNPISQENSTSIFRKGMSYFAYNESIPGIIYCTAAIEQELKKWGENNNVDPKSIKECRKNFNDYLKTSNMEDAPEDFIKKVTMAIDIRNEFCHNLIYKGRHTDMRFASVYLVRYFGYLLRSNSGNEH